MHRKFKKTDAMCMAMLGILIGLLVPLEQSIFADSNGSPGDGGGGGGNPPGDGGGGGGNPPGDGGGGGGNPPGDGGGSHHSKHHNGSSFSTVKGSKHSRLIQIPSVATDFPDNDQRAIEVHVTSAKKDIIGSYHIVGEIKNLSNDTLQFVQVTGHLYDANGQPVGVTTCCYATPSDIEPGHTSTFDSFAQKDQISGKPTSFKLSYDWQ
jgi:hypothetical protein